jgi:hypothetical protein
MTVEPRANIIQHLEPDGSVWYECGWHHLPMPDNRCPKCDTYPTYEAMRADLAADSATE